MRATALRVRVSRLVLDEDVAHTPLDAGQLEGLIAERLGGCSDDTPAPALIDTISRAVAAAVSSRVGEIQSRGPERHATSTSPALPGDNR
jgi:hypothetical protein